MASPSTALAGRLAASGVLLAMVLSSVAPAHAQANTDTDTDTDTDTGSRDPAPWRFQLTPYVWMSGLEGRVRPFARAPLVHVDKSFSQVLESLDAAAFLTGTARHGRFVLQADVTQARSSDSAALPIGVDARVRLRQRSASLTAGYAWVADEHTTLDLMAGLRQWDIQAAVAVPGLLAAGSDTAFVDPIVALRWHQQLSPRWSSVAYVDAGGLGVGSDSTWQLLALANYHASGQLYVSAGYRHQYVDYRNAGKRLDVALSGPMLGLTWRWGGAPGVATASR